MMPSLLRHTEGMTDGPAGDDIPTHVAERASAEEHERELERIRALLAHIQAQTKGIKEAAKAEHSEATDAKVEGLLERTEALLEEVEELYDAETQA